VAKKSDPPEGTTVKTQAPECYPWHEALWEMTRRARTRLPHALLLQGLAGLGKHAFAMRLARSLLCMAPDDQGDACGKCKSCALLQAGSHPDIAMVSIPGDSKVIPVDQIRNLIDFMSLKPHTAAHKVAVLWPAHAMNVNAANSLLKVLEEPPAGSYLLLVSDHAGRIPATVRSRCTRLTFRVPARDTALNWLEQLRAGRPDNAQLLALAGGAPLTALAFAESNSIEQRESLLADLEKLSARRETPCACAGRWKSVGAESSLEALYGLVADLVRVGAVGPGVAVMLPQTQERLHRISKCINLKDLYGFLDATSEAASLVRSQLDPLLLIEDLLIRWQRVAPGVV